MLVRAASYCAQAQNTALILNDGISQYVPLTRACAKAVARSVVLTCHFDLGDYVMFRNPAALLRLANVSITLCVNAAPKRIRR